MSSLTKTFEFNSKEELEKWLKENEGKVNYIVRDASGNKLKEGKKGRSEGFLGGVGDFLQDMFIRPVQVAGVGLTEGLGNLTGNEGLKVAARNYARENLPVSWLLDYEKDPLKATAWNVLDTVLTYGTFGTGGLASKGLKLGGNLLKGTKGMLAVDKLSDTAKVANSINSTVPVLGRAIGKGASQATATLIGDLATKGRFAPLPNSLEGVLKNVGFRAPVDAVEKLKAERFLKKMEEIDSANKFGAKDIKEFFNTVRSSIPKVQLNPLVKNAGLGALSYEISTPSEDKNLGGYLLAGALGAGVPAATEFVGKNIFPKLFKGGSEREFFGESKLSGGSVKELAEKDIATIMKRAMINKGDDALKVEFSPVSGHPEYSFGNTLVDKFRNLGLWFMWAPDKKEKYPTRDLDFAKSALTNIYAKLEDYLGKPIQINARNNETIKKAMETARRKAAEFANKRGPINTQEITDRFRGFFEKSKLEEKAQDVAKSRGIPPTDEAIAQITEELFRKGASEMMLKLPFATKTTNLNKLASAIEKGEPVEFLTLDKAIREINDALETYKSRKPSFREKGELALATTVKDILKEFQERYIPNIGEWDKSFVALNKFISKPGSGSVREATWYWGSVPAILRSMGKPVSDFAANSLMWLGFPTTASKESRSRLASATKNFLTRISDKNATPYTVGAYPGFAENTRDRLGEINASAAEYTKRLIESSEKEAEEEIMRQAEAAISQKKQELLDMRNLIFEKALASGHTITNAKKLADFYVEGQLKDLENMQKKARLTVEEQKQKVRAHVGMIGVETLKEIAKDPATLNMITFTAAVTPGWLNIARPPEVQLFEQAVLQISEAMSRALSGAAIKEDEMERFLKMVPRFGDTKETLDYKLKSLESFFKETLPEIERRRLQQLEFGDLPTDLDTLLENRDIILDSIK